MSLFSPLPSTKRLKELATSTPSLLKEKKKVSPDGDTSLVLHKHPWEHGLNTLVFECNLVTAGSAADAMTSKGKSISKARFHPTGVFTLEAGWLATGEHEIMTFLPVKSIDGSDEQAKLQIRHSKSNSGYTEREIVPGEPILIHESVSFRTEPASVPYIPIMNIIDEKPEETIAAINEPQTIG